jgi:hypothetical protein
VVYKDGAEVKEYNFYRGKIPAEDQIQINYDLTAHDPVYNVDYPVEESITALDDAGNTLDLHWSLIRFLNVFFDVPDPFEDTVTFEIISAFSGTFYEAATGTTVPISGTGWSDWSGPALP